MFRYDLVPSESEPSLRFDGAFRSALVDAGYTAVGRYRASYRDRAAFAGEIFVDPTGTIAASIHQHVGTLNASLHTELADGTYVLTERLPPKSTPIVAVDNGCVFNQSAVMTNRSGSSAKVR